MAGGAKPNSNVPPSMHEGLKMILGELGGLMAAQDADVQFLTQLQHVIVARIKQSTQQSIHPGGQPGQGQPGAASGPGAGNSIAPGGGAGPAGLHSGGAAGMGGPGAGGPPPGPGGPQGAPNPDELQRVLGGAGGPG